MIRMTFMAIAAVTAAFASSDRPRVPQERLMVVGQSPFADLALVRLVSEVPIATVPLAKRIRSLLSARPSSATATTGTGIRREALRPHPPWRLLARTAAGTYPPASSGMRSAGRSGSPAPAPEAPVGRC
jgi:hypothetical protein